MSPEIRIYDQVEIEIADIEGRSPCPKLSVTASDKTQEVISDNGLILGINMDGINGTRPIQHLVLTGPAVGERLSIPLDNITGRARTYRDGEIVDVYVPKATDQTRKERPAREKGSRKKPIPSKVVVPYRTDLYVEG